MTMMMVLTGMIVLQMIMMAPLTRADSQLFDLSDISSPSSSGSATGGSSPGSGAQQQQQQQQQQQMLTTAKCEPLNADILQLCSDIGYNETRFPNFMKHKTQQEAALETALYLPLVRLNCSPALKRFLCSLYAPPCVTNYQQALKPCREMCERARQGCEHYMKRFSFGWPDYIDCWRFPSVTANSEACVADADYSPPSVAGPSASAAATSTAHPSGTAGQLDANSFLGNLSPQQQQILLSSLTGAGAKANTVGSGASAAGGSSPNNNYFQQLYAAAIAAAIAATSNTLQMQSPTSYQGQNGAHNTNPNSALSVTSLLGGGGVGGSGNGVSSRVKFTCPPVLQLQSPYQQSSQYYLTVDDEVVQTCGMPCDNSLFTSADISFARSWVLVWSVLCFASTLFTSFTFLIERSRFRYPERPIIFLSACYLMISFAYMLGSSHLDNNSLVCKMHKNSLSSVARSYIIQGTDSIPCTLSFMCIYFFTMASATWWVVLTFTWFLAAGLKWGHEAIEQISIYFHLAAWTLPLVKLLAVLWMQRVDADILAGVCFVGIRNMTIMRAFVLIPLLFYLAAGTAFLLLGFISLFRIRVVMKHEGNKTDKLEKFMVRIGVFSILYMVPAIIVICCLFYEQSIYPRWIENWLKSNFIEFNLPPDYYSQSSILDLSSASSASNAAANDMGASFIFSLFMLKYAMILVVGITSGFWIWSRKTVVSWSHFISDLLKFFSFGVRYTKNEAQV